jgi:undecaprenyl-diphosphatase
MRRVLNSMSIISFEQQPAQHLSHYVLGCITATLLFTLLLLSTHYLPVVTQWDMAISSWVQHWRSTQTDRIILGLTLMGDVWVGAIIVVIALACLLSAQRWWLSIHLACVSLSAYLSVSILKSITTRPRPVITNGALDAFSFPSGHACTAALTTGLLALLFGYRQTPVVRYGIYALAALLALSIAFSRVYLLAHWPTDVIAGLALGYALIVTFAWQLHMGVILELRYLTPILAALSSIVVIVHIALTFSDQAPRYGILLM